ncbi:hypothetical protein [Micromonospora echinofusca]|uniref:Uncharacterized protein n=1 Tax=Micromonospora echinofusca TaxID=47858 RepID=A0ABS3VWF2_MICEH|nr:hypothetical protein [Micromonospora echinofusca]MBO4208876.1 hypothetical protein [Micromonospora echinofusca]
MIEPSAAEPEGDPDVPAHRSRGRSGYAGFTVVFVLAAALMTALTVCGGLALAVWFAARG